jgi:DNA-binding MarR family transcriptional regulator
VQYPYIPRNVVRDMRGQFIELKAARVRVTRAGKRLAELLSESPGLTQTQIAAQLGVSQPAVSQALRTLRRRAIRTLAA